MVNNIVDRALEKLNWGRIQWDWREQITPNELDGKLTIVIDDKRIELDAVVKREVHKHHLLKINELKNKYFQNFILIGDIINQKMRGALRENKINYIDGGGNAYLDLTHIFIFIEKEEREKKQNEQIQPGKGRLFGTGGLKIIFGLLVLDDLINKPYRDIAEYTDTALGTVKNVLDLLKINGFIIYINKDTWKLKDKKKLMERWITGYEEKLKNNLVLGKYNLRNKKWDELNLNRETLWGGEPAAEILTKYIVPQIFTIYTTDNRVDFIRNYQLLPDPKGNVNVYQKFWNFELKEFDKTAPPLLIYADLLQTAEPRNLETAKIIYERYLQDKFE